MSTKMVILVKSVTPSPDSDDGFSVLLDMTWTTLPGPDPWKSRSIGVFAANSGKWSYGREAGEAELSGKTSSGNAIVIILRDLVSMVGNPFKKTSSGTGSCRLFGDSTTTTDIEWEVVSIF